MKLMVFGSLNIDDVYQLPHFVRGGETISSTSYARNAGGKGFNQAMALAKAGREIWFAGAIGQDGLFLKEQLECLLVHTEHLQVLNTPTGHAIIQVNADGNNCIILYGGANRMISPQMMESALNDMEAGDWILMQNEISGGETLLKMAAERSIHVALNPSPLSEELLAMPLHLVELFILNEVEAEDMTGQTEPEAMLDALQKKYPAARFVLTLGGEGAIYAEGGVRIRQAAFPAEAVDTTAAGDTFTGYFLHTLLKGTPPAQCLEIAARAAAITVGRPGAGESIPVMEEVQKAMP